MNTIFDFDTIPERDQHTVFQCILMNRTNTLTLANIARATNVLTQHIRVIIVKLRSMSQM